VRATYGDRAFAPGRSACSQSSCLDRRLGATAHVERPFGYDRPVELADLVSLQRSAAMLSTGQKMPVDRDELLDMCGELIETRRLLARLGGDLKTVARRAKG